MNPPALLDPVIMSLPNYYQEPMCLDPLDPDPDKNGAKSDHRIVLIRPINTINNKSCRQTREVKVRPFPQSGFSKMRDWFVDQTWDEAYTAESAHLKAEIFQKLLVNKLDEIFPEKTRKIQSDDAPWITFKLKQMDRKRKRIFHKQRRSEKWKKLDQNFKKRSQKS